MMAMMATTAATAAAIATAATVTRMAAAAAMAGHSLVGTADQGDPDDREKDRDPKNQCAIHPRILQLQVPWRNKVTVMPSNESPHPTWDGRQAGQGSS
jgi:opacity protein-like surface antigen